MMSLVDYLAICETRARCSDTRDSKDWDGHAEIFTGNLVLDTAPAAQKHHESQPF
jgi:hypothetical protein